MRINEGAEEGEVTDNDGKKVGEVRENDGKTGEGNQGKGGVMRGNQGEKV